MIVLGVILLVGGAMSALYGNSVNNDAEAQFNSFWESGRTNSGDIFIYIGVFVAIIGVLLIVLGILTNIKSSNDQEKTYINPENVWICPKCGNQTDYNFCEICGTVKPVPETPPFYGEMEKPKFCYACGKQLNCESNFCQYCGTAVTYPR